MSIIETAVSVGGNVGLALSAISGTVLVFTAIATVVVLGTVANLTVTLQQRGYALWQLLGISAGRIRGVVSAQLLAVAVVGAAVGCAVALPGLQPFYDVVFDANPDLGGVHLRFDVLGAAAVVAFVAVLVLLSGSRAAGRAGRVPPVQTLREPDPPQLHMSVGRWTTAVATFGVLVAVALSLPGTALDRLDTPLMLIAPLLAGCLAALGPRLYPPLLAGWTRVLPDSRSAA